MIFFKKSISNFTLFVVSSYQQKNQKTLPERRRCIPLMQQIKCAILFPSFKILSFIPKTAFPPIPTIGFMPVRKKCLQAKLTLFSA